MIVEKKINAERSKFYAYVGCLTGGDGVFVDPKGKLSIFKITSPNLTAVSGIELTEVLNFVVDRHKKEAPKDAEASAASTIMGSPNF